MDILEGLKNLFSPKQTLKDLSLDELRRERIRLEQTEGALLTKVGEIESKKRELFLSGKDGASERQQVIVARKIKELDVQARNYDKGLLVISQQARTLEGHIGLKEAEGSTDQSGLLTLLANVELAALEVCIQEASVEGELKMDKLRETLCTESVRIGDGK